MFTLESEASNKTCPVLTGAYLSQPGKQSYEALPCMGARCMFWRRAHVSTAGQLGYCGAAHVAPHRDLVSTDGMKPAGQPK